MDVETARGLAPVEASASLWLLLLPTSTICCWSVPSPHTKLSHSIQLTHTKLSLSIQLTHTMAATHHMIETLRPYDDWSTTAYKYAEPDDAMMELDDYHHEDYSSKPQPQPFLLEAVHAQFYVPSKGRMSAWQSMWMGFTADGFSFFCDHDQSCFMSFTFGNDSASLDTLVAHPTRLVTHCDDTSSSVVAEITMQLDVAYYGDEDCDESIPIRLRPRCPHNNNNTPTLQQAQRFVHCLVTHLPLQE